MANIIVCSAAEVDYTESLCWYAERSVDAANDFDTEFDRALTHIAADPEHFRCATLATGISSCGDSRSGSFIKSPAKTSSSLLSRTGRVLPIIGSIDSTAVQQGVAARAYGTPSTFIHAGSANRIYRSAHVE